MRNADEQFLGIEERTVTLIEAFTDHNNQIKQLIGNGFAYGTWERYETSLRCHFNGIFFHFNFQELCANSAKFSMRIFASFSRPNFFLF